MKKLSKISLLVLAIIFTSSVIFAAEPTLKEGSKSLYFGFNGLSELSVDNSYFGGQYLFADNMGVWISLGMSFITDKPSKDAKDQTTNDFEIDLGYIYYIFQKGPVACYFSPQVGIGFGTEENTSTTFTKKTTNMFYIGCSIGCEWWFTEGISIGASTFFGFESDKTKTEVTTTSEVESTTTTIGIIPSPGANLFLNFYF